MTDRDFQKILETLQVLDTDSISLYQRILEMSETALQSETANISFMKEQITYDIFEKIDIRLGTVLSVKKNEKARKPSLVVEVDFGKEIGVKTSSAQITHFYSEQNLIGKQVIGVCNFPEKNIAGVKSQFLLLGSIDSEGKVTLVHPSQKAENGLPIA